MYERFPTRLIPELWRSPPDVYFRAGVLVALSITLMAITAGCFFVALFAYDLPVVAWANLGALVMSALALLSIARGISLRLSTDLLCSSTIVAVAVVVGAVEGLTSPALIWLTGVPLVAALGAGWRRAVGWTSIMLAAVVGLVVLDHFGLHRILAESEDPRRVLAAASVEEHQRIAGAQPQHARDVIRRASADLDGRARGERRFDVHAGQSHVARSMPSRATPTMRSISSSEMT